MQLSVHSSNKLLQSLSNDGVPKDYADPIYNYLVYGFEPGSFFTSLLANDAMGAISRSHPANTIIALKTLVQWIRAYLPNNGTVYGSYDAVNRWVEMSEEDRRSILESKNLIYSKEDEILLALKGEKTFEPLFI